MCGILKSSFPKLYSIASDKEALVSDYLDSFDASTALPIGIRVSQGLSKIESLTFFLICYTPRKHIWSRLIECCGPQLANHGFEVKSY